MSLRYFKIGQVAELLNLTVRTIRYYEEEGLLQPRRTNGGTRLYTQQHVSRLRAIVQLTENGFPLDVIGSIGKTRETCKTGREGCEKVSRLIDSSICDIEKKINRLIVLQTELSAAKTIVNKCSHCDKKPSSTSCPECPVNHNLSKVEILNLVWE
jgi:MerR family transcriptional regulator, Zn(II)-responsive regulator of zntA